MGVDIDIVQFAIQGLDGLFEFDLERLLQGEEEKKNQGQFSVDMS
jgi:hypothetical protein